MDTHSIGSLTPQEAYLAMYYFIDAYWERGRRNDGNAFLLRHAVGPEADPDDAEAYWTTDPACWSYWVDAVEKARSIGLPSRDYMQGK